MFPRALASLALAAALAGAGAACRAAPEPDERPPAAQLGFMTTLPLYWAEAAGVGELLQADREQGWVRQALETRFELVPLDTLEEGALAASERLMLAQPRALSSAENVALDAWVRGGGRLLLFADPMLTRESRFGIGDKRRPQDVVLLSPILAHWGLALAFDPAQSAEERLVEVAGAAVPVAMRGQLSAEPGAPCTIAGDGLLARCRIGEGSITVLADAALLDDPEGGDTERRSMALLRLTALAFEP